MDLLTVNEVMALLHVTERCLAAWRAKGEGPAFVRLGRRCLYNPRSVEQFIRLREISGRPCRKCGQQLTGGKRCLHCHPGPKVIDRDTGDVLSAEKF